jgi:hypothetical protein
MECYYFRISYLSIYSSSDSEPDRKNHFRWIQYISLKVQILFLICSLFQLRTQLTVIQIIFDGKKLVKRYLSSKMSIERPWNFTKMYSNIYMPHEYVETEVCETMALYIVYVGL